MNHLTEQQVRNWTSRRVLVTGADGFVGRWLVRVLSENGAQVLGLVWSGSSVAGETTRVVDDHGSKVVRGDVRDYGFVSQLIEDSGVDLVYHLAAINTNTGPSILPYDVLDTNIRGVYTVLEACRTAPREVQLVVASSEEAGDCFMHNEGRKLHPYMTSKASAELLVRAYVDTYNLPAVVVRSSTVYGGGDFNWGRLIPGTIRAVLHGRPPVIRSNGLLQRDYVFIEDVVRGYLAIAMKMEQPAARGRLFHLATGISTSVLDAVNRICCITGRPDLKPQVMNEKYYERGSTSYVPVLEGDVLGWKSIYSLDAGLTQTCAWYREYFRTP